MDLLWPGFLMLLGLIPLLIFLYIWQLRRRRRFAVRFSSLSLVRSVLPRQSRWKRHLPFGIFLAALLSLVIALMRPVTIVSVPTDQTTIIITMDVSLSMRAADIPPSRLEAAEAAALSFVSSQKSKTRIGLVAFSGFAEIIQPPTTDQEALDLAIQSLTVGRRTAIGSGILTSIDAIAEIDKNVAPSVINPSAAGSDPVPVPKGAYAPDIIVLLTDGVSNAGPSPIAAAQQAVDRGIRIYTIGYGTPNGALPYNAFDPQQGGGGGRPNGGGGGGGGGFRTGIDETVLKEIASMTGGEHYSATSANELLTVFQDLPTYLITKHEVTEISVGFAALGALLAGIAIFLSLLWHPLP
jgi:Ca-activated chloride channel homolog